MHFGGAFFFHVILVAGWQGCWSKGHGEENRRRVLLSSPRPLLLTSRSRQSWAGQMSCCLQRDAEFALHMFDHLYIPSSCPDLRSIHCHNDSSGSKIQKDFLFECAGKVRGVGFIMEPLLSDDSFLRPHWNDWRKPEKYSS